MNWTKGQKQAIESQSGDITVAASAGTGKTTVLSQRAVRILASKELRPEISDILVLTFTDAAAGEMKSRIAQNLREAAAHTKDAHLRRQLLLLDDADISTIHSFCRRVISQNFHRLGLDPAFRVMDEDEIKLIKDEILEQVVEDAWQDLPQDMHRLLEGRTVTNFSNDFLSCIIDISDFLDTVVSHSSWFDRAMVLNDAMIIASSEAVKNQKQIILDKLEIFRERLEWSLKLDEEITGGHWKHQIEGQCLATIMLAIDFLEKDDFKSFVELLSSFDGFRWDDKPKGLDSEIREFVLSAAIKTIKNFKELNELAVINPDYERLIAGGCAVQVKILIELVKRFDNAYSQRKQGLKCVDFADLERFMLKLLSEGGDVDSGKASDIALQLQKKYKYIFVDEYQDINPVQQRIIDLLAGCAKVFVVGDAKQSIYGWRGADCSLFVGRLGKAGDDESKSRVDLNENFRSRPGILNFVNEVFSRIMTSSIAAIDYDESAALKAFNASSAGSEKGPDVELLIVDDDPAEEEQENISSISSEKINSRAVMVADRIKQLVEVEKFEIYDKSSNSYRQCRWSDIVILMRSFENRANNYVQILSYANIPVVSDSSVGYFATTEISDMISLLQVLDNPRQDIPLAAVLRSPLLGFSDNEFLQIKSQKKERLDFYSLLESAAMSFNEENLRQKISDCLQRLDNWRSIARRGSLADLIWQIYSETGYLSFVSALPGGSQRRANLLKLHQRAIQFENFASSSSVISLSRFVNFLQKLIESRGDWAPAEPDSSAANAVRIMSIHKSKGLEFPVVILAEMNRQFRNIDNGDCITDSRAGIGLKIIEKGSGSKLPSLTWQLIREGQKKQNLAEEMRILYVAMTRAKDKLILSGAAESKSCIRLLSNAALCDFDKLPRWLIEDARSELDWILLSLAKYKKLHNYFEPLIKITGIDENLFDLSVCGGDKVSRLEKQLLRKRQMSRYDQIKSPIQDELMLNEIRRNLNWQYPFKNCASIKAKQSVTSLLQQQEQFAGADYNFSFEHFNKSKDKTVNLVVGNATHMVIRNIDLSLDVNEMLIESTISDLVGKGCLTKQIAERVNIDSILKFFNSDLGRILRDSKNKVMREWPFTYSASVADIYPDLETCRDEKVIVQGIVDVLIQTANGIIIIDFKTDKINSGDINQRAEHYLPQIKWYCKAASEILNAETVSGYLYFLSVSQAVKVY